LAEKQNAMYELLECFTFYSGDLAKAVKSKPGLHFGLYHSMMDWFHPLYLQDKANGWKTDKFPVVCMEACDVLANQKNLSP